MWIPRPRGGQRLFRSSSPVRCRAHLQRSTPCGFVDETWMANGAMLRRVSRPASIGPLSTLHPYQEDSHRGVNIVALRRWIKLKARRRFRKALGAPQSAKIHRPKIKNSHSGNRQNRAERGLHVTHQVKNRTQYLHSYVCLVAVVIDFLRCWTVRAPRPTI
jgi:hypothetical protein